MGRHKRVELIRLKVELITSTDKAILINSDFGKSIWIPISVLAGKSYSVFRNANPWLVEFVMPVWLAKKKGVIR